MFRNSFQTHHDSQRLYVPRAILLITLSDAKKIALCRPRRLVSRTTISYIRSCNQRANTRIIARSANWCPVNRQSHCAGIALLDGSIGVDCGSVIRKKEKEGEGTRNRSTLSRKEPISSRSRNRPFHFYIHNFRTLPTIGGQSALEGKCHWPRA